MASKKRRSWDEMELRDKLGYIWVISFGIMAVATAAVILVPTVLDWLEEYGGEEEEDAMLRRPAIEYRLAVRPEVELYDHLELARHDCRAGATGSLPVSRRLG